MKEKITKSKFIPYTAFHPDEFPIESRKEIILEAECNGVKYAVGDRVVGKNNQPFTITELYYSYDKEHILAGPNNVGIRKVWHYDFSTSDPPPMHRELKPYGNAKPCDNDGKYPFWRRMLYELQNVDWKPYILAKPCNFDGRYSTWRGMLSYISDKPNQKSNNMKSMKVNAPEGYVIDTEKSTTTEVFFKKKDDRPRKWSDIIIIDGYYISETSNIRGCMGNSHNSNKNAWPTKELAEAALALSELMQYRQRWIGEWKQTGRETCYIIYCTYPDSSTSLEKDNGTAHGVHSSLSFPTVEMRDDFKNTFRELIEIAKPLL